MMKYAVHIHLNLVENFMEMYILVNPCEK